MCQIFGSPGWWLANAKHFALSPRIYLDFWLVFQCLDWIVLRCNCSNETNQMSKSCLQVLLSNVKHYISRHTYPNTWILTCHGKVNDWLADFKLEDGEQFQALLGTFSPCPGHESTTSTNMTMMMMMMMMMAKTVILAKIAMHWLPVDSKSETAEWARSD